MEATQFQAEAVLTFKDHDNPIEEQSQDILNRYALAEVIAHDILDANVNRGAVFGIMGSWGSGKSSLLNLVRVSLHDDSRVDFIEFNPWLFSNTDQLVGSFLAELALALQKPTKKSKKFVKAIAGYSQKLKPLSVVPVAGMAFGLIAAGGEMASNALSENFESLAEQRAKVEKYLGALDRTIAVIVDDVDRLTSAEIRDVFKLVRLTANFPNILYLVAFDRERIELALNEDGFPGDAYLEKILQRSYDLPPLSDDVILQALWNEIVLSVGDLPHRFDEALIADVLQEIVAPLMENYRDIGRYARAVRTRLRLIGDNVQLTDVLALEAIRSQMPADFAKLHSYRLALTTPWVAGDDGPRVEKNGAEIEKLIGESKRPEVIQALIRRVFPFAERFLTNTVAGYEQARAMVREGRVGEQMALKYYLELIPGNALKAFWDVNRILSETSDSRSLEDAFFTSSTLPEIDLILAVDWFCGELSKDKTVELSAALLNRSGYLSQDQRGPFLDSPRKSARVAAVHLIVANQGSSAIEQIVKEVLALLRTFSSRMILLTWVYDVDRPQDAKVTKEFYDVQSQIILDGIIKYGSESLAKESDALDLLLFVKDGSFEEWIQEIVANRDVREALVRNAIYFTSSRSIYSRFASSSQEARIADLIQVFGSRADLQSAMDDLNAPAVDATLEKMIATIRASILTATPGQISNTIDDSSHTPGEALDPST